MSERVFKYIKSNAEVNSVHGAKVYFPNGINAGPIPINYLKKHMATDHC